MRHSAFTPRLQSIAALWLVLIFCPAEGRRLSWPGWLATNTEVTTSVLTVPDDVYHCATPPAAVWSLIGQSSHDVGRALGPAATSDSFIGRTVFSRVWESEISGADDRRG